MKRSLLLAFIVCCNQTGDSSLNLTHHEPLEDCATETIKLESPVSVFVTPSIYHAVESQCDSDPFVTACNKRITDPSTDRIVALSRNLLKPSIWHSDSQGYNLDAPFAFGDSIYVQGTGELDGIWYIYDSMNRRHTNRIDFLVNQTIRGYDFPLDGIIITAL